MKLEKVIIENFRAYEKVEIQFDNLNVIVGKNDAGKSTILEALDIFFDNRKMDEEDIKKDSNKDEVKISACFSGFPEKIDIDSGNETSLKDEYLLNEKENLEIVKVYKDNSLKPEEFILAKHPTSPICKDLLLKKNNELKDIISNNEYDNTKINNSKNADLRKVIWENNEKELKLENKLISLKTGDAKNIGDKLRNYLPTYALFQVDRTNEDKDPEIQVPFKSTIKEFLKKEEIKNQLNQIAESILQETTKITDKTLEKLKEVNPVIAQTLSASIPEVKDLKWAEVFKNVSIIDDNKISLNKRGSGVKRLILLSFFRASAEEKTKENKNIIYAIEEPETSQHLKHQNDLIDALKKLSESNTQIFLTTHSTQIVRSIFSPENELKKNYKFLIVQKNDQNLSSDINDKYKKYLPYPSANEISCNVFDVYQEEYHTELYSYIQKNYKDLFDKEIKCKKNKKEKNFCLYKKGDKEEYITLTQYIRHQIHHPENIKNNRYKLEDLEKSIKIMQNLLSKKMSVENSTT